MEQKYFNYHLEPSFQIENYFVGSVNEYAFNFLINDNLNFNNFFLNGPSKSGKTHLSLIWKDKYNAISYDNNLNEIISGKENVLIDDFFFNLIEEDLFHIINHCALYNIKILITSNLTLSDFDFKLTDLSSRLKIFQNIKIDLPNDELLLNLMIKLFHDKQIIIKNPEIFDYIIKRINRSYKDVFNLISEIDKLLLKRKKQLTIPLIKELI